jgi:hypothetical protein
MCMYVRFSGVFISACDTVCVRATHLILHVYTFFMHLIYNNTFCVIICNLIQLIVSIILKTIALKIKNKSHVHVC